MGCCPPCQPGPTSFFFPNRAASHTFRRTSYRMTDNSKPRSGAGRFLPRIGSPAYHVMLASVAILPNHPPGTLG